MKGKNMQKITPFLWFDDQAEEAANFYASIFKKSKIGNVTRYGEADSEVSRRPKGSVMTVTFQLDGQEFIALNGGPIFKFTEAVSFLVNCETQEEVDELRRLFMSKTIPDGFQSVTLLFMFKDARKAIEFCKSHKGSDTAGTLGGRQCRICPVGERIEIRDHFMQKTGDGSYQERTNPLK